MELLKGLNFNFIHKNENMIHFKSLRLLSKQFIMHKISNTFKNIFIAKKVNPKISNSFERHLLESHLVQPCMFIRRATPTIVLGCNQNPWLECNVAKIKEDNVDIMRRYTGGGTVYLDPSNLLVGFVNKTRNIVSQTDINNKIVTDAIKSTFSVNAASSGRNDIVVDGKKVAGSAFRVYNHGENTYHMHHLCILVNGDLEKLSTYLTPSKKKLESKGVTSVKARVANLCSSGAETEKMMDKFKIELINNFANESEYKLIPISEDEMLSIKKVSDEYKKLNDNEYTYGATPDFTHMIENKFSWGLVNVCLKVSEGNITNTCVYTDSLHIDFVQTSANILNSTKYSRRAILNKLSIFMENNTNSNDVDNLELYELIRFVANNID